MTGTRKLCEGRDRTKASWAWPKAPRDPRDPRDNLRMEQLRSLIHENRSVPPSSIHTDERRATSQSHKGLRGQKEASSATSG